MIVYAAVDEALARRLASTRGFIRREAAERCMAELRDDEPESGEAPYRGARARGGRAEEEEISPASSEAKWVMSRTSSALADEGPCRQV